VDWGVLIMLQVLSIARRESGAGEMVRDGVLWEWRLVWVIRGVGEYVSRGKRWVVGLGGS
jgi:hypothetical protein